MIDHISLSVSDLSASKAFYSRALAPLGYSVLMDLPEHNAFGMGAEGKPDLWIVGDGAGKSTHIAFLASSEAVMRKFYEEALAAGGKDNGKPGPRPEYSDTYNGAFVFDPDGNNIEAVWYSEKK